MEIWQLSRSPNDPIFYFHHRNIDRYWSMWQKKSPGNAVACGGFNHENKTDLMEFLGGIEAGVTVNVLKKLWIFCLEVLRVRMCYHYQNSITPISPPALVRETLSKTLLLLAHTTDPIDSTCVPLNQFPEITAQDDEV